MTSSNLLEDRIAEIERRIRRYQFALVSIAIIAPTMSLWMPRVDAQGAQDQIRARTLIIEDANGRDRIVFGAPIREAAGRISASTGLKILDPSGAERFGMGLLENGQMVMGFDAPPGTGDERNRERISIVADARGGAYIRFLNRKTQIPGRLVLGNDDKLSLEFWENVDGKLTLRVLDFAGDRVVAAQ
jgi:hypothetical protein